MTAREFPRIVALNSRAVAPDGARIAYSAQVPGANGVYVSPVMGGRPVLLSYSNRFGVSWSPNGESIALVLVKPNGAPALATLRVGANEPPFEVLNLPEVCTLAPEWSPSGEWIACGTANGPLLVSPDGRRKRMLTPLNSSMLAWSKDGRTLYGLSPRNGRLLLMAEDIATAAVRQVADYGPGLEPFGDASQ